MHRGNCSFTDKANFAEAAGASAILIINNRAGLALASHFLQLLVYCNVLMKSKSFFFYRYLCKFGHY